MMMKNLNKREKYLVILLGTVIILFVYFKYFLMPVLDNINNSRADIDKYNSQISQLKITEIANSESKRELTKIKLSYKDALLKLPPLEKNPEIAYNIKPFADANNVNLESVSFSDGTLFTPGTGSTQNSNGLVNNSNLYSTTVNINVSADNYFDMMNFVNALENDKRLNEITVFSIQSQNNNPADATTQASTDDNPKSKIQLSTNMQIINANIAINYFYNLDNKVKPNYDFNKGSYGKTDVFK